MAFNGREIEELRFDIFGAIEFADLICGAGEIRRREPD